MTGWLARLHLIRPTEEHQMSQSQFGPQGSPLTVPSTPSKPAPDAEAQRGYGAPVETAGGSYAHSTPALPGDAGVSVDAAETAQPSGLVPPIARAADKSAAEATLLKVQGLVTAWNNVAETTLVRGEYEKGQRDATLTRADELRAVLGI